MPQQQSRAEQEKVARAHQEADAAFERFLDLLGRLIARRATLDRNSPIARGSNENAQANSARKIE